MKMKMLDLMALYAPATPVETRSETPSAERITALTLRKIGKGAAKRPPRLRIAVLAAAVCLVLSVSVLALSGRFDYAEILPALRQFLGIEAGTVTGMISYARVTEADDAHWAYSGRYSVLGELYVTDGRSVVSENLLTGELIVSCITREQFETADWRVRVAGADSWYRVEPTAYYPYPGMLLSTAQRELDCGWGTFHLTLFPEQLPDGELGYELCCGAESEDGKTYHIERSGVFSLEPPTYRPALSAEFSPGIPVSERSGVPELGTIETVEITADYMILRLHSPLLADRFEIARGTHDETFNRYYSELNTDLQSINILFEDGYSLDCGYCDDSFGDGEDNYYLIKRIPASCTGKTPSAISIHGEKHTFDAR